MASFSMGNTEYSQQMPYNLEAEQSVLGAVLIDSGCFPLVLENLKADNFYRPQHQQIFEIMVTMFNTSKVMDFITILERGEG